MHLDMNSYFASVEQQANPFLRGRPIGVCAYLGENGCIIASSIEAKQRGVKTGMRVREARQKCPEIICIENDPLKYRSTTRKIFSILADYTDHVEPYSIDECFLKFPNDCHSGEAMPRPESDRILDSPHRLARMTKVAQETKQRIKTDVGTWLKCSVGIAPTRWLAKFGSDFQKPDGLTIVTMEQLGTMYEKVKLTDAWGIGSRIEDRLNRLGIWTLNDLRTYPVTNLMEVMGVQGYYLWANVNGIEISLSPYLLTSSPPAKSIGHSYCLPKKTTDTKYLFCVLMKLCEKTGRRLREDGRVAWSISCAWGFAQGGGDSAHRKAPQPLWSTESIFATAQELFCSRRHSEFISESHDQTTNILNQVQDDGMESPISFLAVSVADLRPHSDQLSFWDTPKSSSQQRIVKAMDTINNVYGEYTIMRGRLFGMDDYAHDRIGFRKTVEVERVPKESVL